MRAVANQLATAATRPRTTTELGGWMPAVEIIANVPYAVRRPAQICRTRSGNRSKSLKLLPRSRMHAGRRQRRAATVPARDQEHQRREHRSDAGQVSRRPKATAPTRIVITAAASASDRDDLTIPG